MAVAVRDARYPADGPVIRALLEEYHGTVGVDLCFQDFAGEVASLPGEYVPPLGALLVAEEGGTVLGCVALHPWDREIAEMKRLFVTGAARGRGAGLALVEAVIARARAIGYRRMWLDSLPSQTAAHRLYEELGFREIGAYRENPVAGTKYYQLALQD